MAGRFSIEAVFKGIDRLTAPVGRMLTSVQRFGLGSRAAFRDVDKGADSVLRSFGSVAQKAALVGAVVAGTAGAALFSIGEAGANFEEAITSVGAVSLMTRDQIADLESKALELGASTKFTATQVANGMETMGRAGFTNAQILSGIAPMLAAAAAEGAEFEPVADVIGSAIKGMGLEMTETGRVADVLTLASAKTKSSILSLGESLAGVASTARQFGIPLEEAVASVALLQDVGLDASVAGSAVNTMLTNLANPTKEVKAQMKALGISFQDAKGNMLPLGQVLGQFQKGAEKSGGNMKQVALFADLVGLRGQKAAANLKDLFKSGQFGTLVKDLQGAKGKAQEMADLRMQNLKGDLTMLGATVDSVKISLFNLESGPMRGLVKSTTAWVGANKALITQRAQDAITAIARAIPAVILWGTRFGKITGVVLGFALAVKAVSLAVAILNGIAAMNPLVLGIYATVAAIALLVAFWPEVRAFFDRIGAARAVFYGVAGAVAISVGALLIYRTAAVVSTAATLGMQGATLLATGAIGARSIALRIGAFATTQYSFATVASTVATIAATSWAWLKLAAQVAYNGVTAAGTAIVGLFTGATTTSTIAGMAATAWAWARAAAQGGLNLVTGLGTGIMNLYAIATGKTAAANAVAAGSLAPFLLTLLAVGAAIGGIVLAYKAWTDLVQQTGGAGGVWEGVKSFAKGDGFFEGVDQHLNDQARAAAKAPPKPPASAPGTGGIDFAAMGLDPKQIADLTKGIPTGGSPADMTAQLAQITKQIEAGQSVQGAATAPAAQPTVVGQGQQVAAATETREIKVVQEGKSEVEIKVPAGMTGDVKQDPKGPRIKVAQSGAL